MIQINELAQSVSATGLTAGMKYAVTVSGDFGGAGEPPVVVSILNRQQGGEYVEIPGVSLTANNRQVTVTVVGDELQFSASPLYLDTILNIEVLRLPLSNRVDADTVVAAIEDNPAAVVAAVSKITPLTDDHVLTAADNGKIFLCATDVDLVIHTPEDDPGVPFSCAFIQGESGGVVVFYASSGTTLNSYNSLNATAGIHAWASLIRTGVNTYNLSGTLI